MVERKNLQTMAIQHSLSKLPKRASTRTFVRPMRFAKTP